MAGQNMKESNPMRVPKGEAVFCYVVMGIICIIALFPVLWVLMSSFKADLLAEPGFALLQSLTAEKII